MAEGGSDAVVIRRGRRWRRIAALIGLGFLLLLLVAVAAVWVARRPIASNVLENEFERRGVQATYDLARVGLRTQVVRNLVIGDPADPDLVARYALIQLRLKWNGGVEVYRIVARGVRLEGRVEQGRVVWGDVSKLLPPPSDKPFEFPNIVVDIADASIGLQTPFGALGFAVEGAGNLSGGFRGKLAAASPRIAPGRCAASDINALVQIRIVARRPHVVGPVAAQRFACPASRLQIERPTFNIDSRFNETFTSFDGRGQIGAVSMIAGENRLALFLGNIRFEGSAEDLVGNVDLAARQSRLGPITADRTRVAGKYRLSTTEGTFAMVGDYSANDAALAPSMFAGITGPLNAAAATPLGPIATAMARGFQNAARQFDASGEIRVVNFPGGGAARVESATVQAANGARARLSGGDGVTYYWPTGRMRVDGRLELGGGGLPTGEILIRQPRNGTGLSGVARFEPYRAGNSRLALDPIRFQAAASGATEFSTAAVLDGPFADGAVRGLRLPLSGRMGADGDLRVGQSCLVASWTAFRFRELQLGPTRLPVCPVGPAIVYKPADGPLQLSGRINQPRLRGRLGSAPLSLDASSALIAGNRDFSLDAVRARLGDPDAPVMINADRLRGSFRGSGISGTFAGGDAVIGNVPLLIDGANGNWRMFRGDLELDGAVTVNDRADEPRFYPLRSNDFRMTLSGNDIRAGGILRHPPSGTAITDVSIRHDLGTGAGGAILDVPGIQFGEGLQPEELTRLTEGVVALVVGTVRGQGRINWASGGKVDSTGEFTTVGMNLAAPFGPVEGLTTTVRFSDLLGLETAPGQTATVGSINPGILVEDGVIRYQLLSDQRVRIERGVWPFMGGTLILQETILNFARPTPKRLTFEVVGLDAKTFVDTLGFPVLEATGTFDGVLPMIFDDAGGRIVGGRLESRPPGGTLAYTGDVGDMGLFARIAFDALRSLRYRSMIIRLDGDLAGEFATRITIDQIALGESTTAGIIRSVTRNLRFKFNITIRGPFRALIQMSKGFRDPTEVIEPVLPFPIEGPGLSTEIRTIRREEDIDQTQPDQEVDISAQPPAASERR